MRAVGGPSEAARLTGKTRTTIDNWRRRGTADLLDVLPLVQQAGVTLDWLAHGAGPGASPDTPKPSALVAIAPLRSQGADTPALGLDAGWLHESFGLDPEAVRAVRLEDAGMAPVLQRGGVVLVDIRPDVELGDLVVVDGPKLVARRHYVMPDGEIQLTADADPNWRYARPLADMPPLFNILWIGQSV